MSRFHRIAAGLIPPPGREWIEAHESELQAIAGRSDRIRWTAGAVPVVIRAFLFQLLRQPRSFIGGPLARRAAAVTGSVLFGFGLFLGVLAGLSSRQRVVPALLAATVLLAAAATPAALRATRRRRPLRTAYFVAATASLLATIGGAIQTFAVDDPEYGPPTVAAALLVHSLAVIVGSGTRRPPLDPDGP